MRGCKNLGLLWYVPKQIRDVIAVMSIAAPKSLMIDPGQQRSRSDPDGAKLVQPLGKCLLLLHASFNRELTNEYSSELKKKNLISVAPKLIQYIGSGLHTPCY